ncbi:MAG: class I SAM-dependent methyltransferase [Methylotenera sp.]|nr:class I SAM-dependent methyltransferase [Methylotenera sp.]MDP2404446.1 class I SAM-dependent methyltransferase [Methylotenera sp.]
MTTNLEQSKLSRHLDLGCGSNPRNPYYADEVHVVDIYKSPLLNSEVIFKNANLSLEKIPYEDDYFDFVSAYDFIEHIPRILNENKTTRFPFIDLMNEIHRVLKPSGIFYAQTPAFPSPEAFQDPTHVNFITQRTHKYFCGSAPRAMVYGFVGKFEARTVRWINGNDLIENQNTLIRIKNHLLKILGIRKNTHLIWELKSIKN